MPTPIELTLTSLLPTHHHLPGPLISLSTSLLAHSRSKASNLKPEEEIGRTYACCHLACVRLRDSLGLELGKIVPPIKPRVYKKLYGFLDAVLNPPAAAAAAAAGAEPRTPKKGERNGARHADGAVRSSGRKRGREEEDAGNEAQQQSTPMATTNPSAKRARQGGPIESSQDTEDASSFLMPLIRHLCKVFCTPRAAPHVFVGVRSTWKERSSTSRIAVSRGQDTVLPSLTVLLYIAVCTRMHGAGKLEEGDQVTGAAVVFCGKNEKLVKEGVGEVEGLEEVMREIMAEGWLEVQGKEWFANVPEGSEGGAGVGERGMDDDLDMETRRRPAKTPLRRKEKHGGVNDEPGGRAGLLPGLGTMFQAAVDWLSEERWAEYERWKTGLLEEIALVEQRA